MQKEIDYNVIEQLISKKFEELKIDILKTISENNASELSSKLDSAVKAQNEFIKKTQNLLMLIDGTYNNVSSIKTPTKIQTRKPKVNNNVIDISTPHDQTSAAIVMNSAPLPPRIDEKTEIKKPKYRTTCINAIMNGKIKLADLESNCVINITEVKKQLSVIKSSTTLNAMDKKEEFKNTLKDFIYKLNESQTDKLKKYIKDILPQISEQ